MCDKSPPRDYMKLLLVYHYSFALSPQGLGFHQENTAVLVIR